MIDREFVVFASYGNDSVALIQWLAEKEITEGYVAYSDTQWGHPAWEARIEQGEELARRYGFETVRIPSIGFVPLAQMRKGFPRQGMQFCTEELKIRPALQWLDQIDPDRELDCLVGVRREESRARSQWPEHIPESPRHGGRDLWAPLVRVATPERDALVRRAGFKVYDGRSMECWPCVNSNRADLRTLTEDRVEEIEGIEQDMGFTAKGKPRTLFRPYRHMGATGIREVVKWANSSRGEYEPPRGGCDSGFCGT